MNGNKFKFLSFVFAIIGLATMSCFVGCKNNVDLSMYKVKFNGSYYESIMDALATNEEGTIQLLKDDEISENYIINNGKELTFDLNGNTLYSNRINIEHGNIKVEGQGIIEGKTSALTSACFSLTGDTDNSNAENYSTLEIGKDVTINNDYFSVIVSNIKMSNSQKSSNQYGINVTFAGKDNSTYGLYTNGNITNETNPAKWLIKDTAEFNAGIYGAGFADWKIEGGKFGNTCEFKSGKVQIDGGEFSAEGNKNYTLNGNGSNFEGYALVVESQQGYGKSANCEINGGKFNTEIVVADFSGLQNPVLTINSIGQNEGILKTQNTIINAPQSVIINNL